MKTVLRYAWLALAAILVGCGGGGDLPVATITASSPQPVRAANMLTGGPKVVIHTFQALYGQAPSNALMSSYLSQIGSGNGFAWANSMVPGVVVSDTELSTRVLNNIGITPTSLTSTAAFGTSFQAYSALQAALADYFRWVGKDNRGTVIVQLAGLLSNMEVDTQFGVYGNAAAAFNGQALANFVYSSNTTSVAPAVVSLVTANAGSAQDVAAGQQVALDGTRSSSASGPIVAYGWTLTTRPVGSSATLSSLTSAKPTFTADVAGTYVVTLIVNDGVSNSDPKSVTITALGNVAPVANAGVAQNVPVGALVTLDGSASSDANSDPLTYAWTLTSKPNGSAATLSSTTSVRATFTADLVGTYVATLVTNDGRLNSVQVTTNVTVAPRIVAALGISLNNSYTFCGITGTFSTFSSSGSGTWTFNNCSVYGTAGSPLMARIQNNGVTPLTLTQISIYTPPFVKNWTIDPTSQTILAGTHVDFSLPLHVGVEVTNATATFSIQGEPPLVVHLTGDMTLAMLLFMQ